jgi:hypothetical protein
METETTDAATAAVEPDAVSGLDERQWMRFPVADEHRSVELIVDGKTKYDAVLVDLSSTGMCVELEESIPVTVGEDVFVDAGYCIHACVVRNHAVKEGSGYQLGLERVKTFPVSQLPKKRRAIRTFLVPATTNSITPVIFVTLISVFGFACLILGLNLNGSRVDLVEWMWPGDNRTLEESATTSSYDRNTRGRYEQAKHRSRTRSQSGQDVRAPRGLDSDKAFQSRQSRETARGVDSL